MLVLYSSVDLDIIVVGASYGGVQALPQLIGDLPVDLPAGPNLQSRAREDEGNAPTIRDLLLGKR